MGHFNLISAHLKNSELFNEGLCLSTNDQVPWDNTAYSNFIIVESSGAFRV